ncbi:MAG TPA: cytochrome c [Polyangia bacterium]|nr:cytochrome c [Polyangia bacterium]
MARERHCVHCHRDILDGRFAAPPRLLARWRSHLLSLNRVPSLEGTGRLLQRAWVRDFLLSPCDVRPALFATMPRLELTPAQADALAGWLVPEEAPPSHFTPAEAAAGRALYERLRCASCHRFTGADASSPPPEPATDSVALAPDLALARVRVQSGALADWLADPQRTKPDALMPRFPIGAPEARALAAFILTAPLAPTPPLRPHPRQPPLRRRVGWDEVSARVFRRTCWHCHGQPDYARGDGGPGNTGGFGFAGRGLDLSSFAGIAAGARGDDGRRRSVFSKGADGEPLLLATLLARQLEQTGRVVPGVRGMPLGLPALSPEDIQLVESWVLQGRPR